MSEQRADGSVEGRFATEIPVRYSDVDTYGHVNNATYATYLEEARIDYLEALLADEDLTGSIDDGDDEETRDGSETAAGDTVGIVVANLEIDFRRAIETAEAVTVRVGVGDIGTSSFTIEYVISTDDGVHAEAETTMVAFDRSARESRPIPDHWRQAIAEFEGIDAE